MTMSAASCAPHSEHDLVRHSYNGGMSTAPRLEAAKRDWGHDETGCTVLHIDMDAFYASLEVARNPGLKGKPVIIGTGPRAVVSAASYEARKYGINSAMPAARAHRLCPNGIFLPVDMAYYRMMSHRIMHEVFLTVTDRFEQVSVDEGYMDVSAALLEWGRPSAIGARRSGRQTVPHHLFRRHRGEQACRQNGFDQCQTGWHAHDPRGQTCRIRADDAIAWYSGNRAVFGEAA